MHVRYLVTPATKHGTPGPDYTRLGAPGRDRMVAELLTVMTERIIGRGIDQPA